MPAYVIAIVLVLLLVALSYLYYVLALNSDIITASRLETINKTYQNNTNSADKDKFLNDGGYSGGSCSAGETIACPDAWDKNSVYDAFLTCGPDGKWDTTNGVGPSKCKVVCVDGLMQACANKMSCRPGSCSDCLNDSECDKGYKCNPSGVCVAAAPSAPSAPSACKLDSDCSDDKQKGKCVSGVCACGPTGNNENDFWVSKNGKQCGGCKTGYGPGDDVPSTYTGMKSCNQARYDTPTYQLIGCGDSYNLDMSCKQNTPGSKLATQCGSKFVADAWQTNDFGICKDGPNGGPWAVPAFCEFNNYYAQPGISPNAFNARIMQPTSEATICWEGQNFISVKHAPGSVANN